MSIHGTDQKRKFSIEAINKQFKIAGYDLTWDDVSNWDINKTKGVYWQEEYTMTDSQKEEWKNWFIHQAGKQLQINLYWAKKEYDKFNSLYGLYVTNQSKNREETS